MSGIRTHSGMRQSYFSFKLLIHILYNYRLLFVYFSVEFLKSPNLFSLTYLPSTLLSPPCKFFHVDLIPLLKVLKE